MNYDQGVSEPTMGAVPDVRPLTESLNQLVYEVDDLHKSIQALRSRLDPLMVQADPTDSADSNKAMETPVRSPFRSSLEHQVEMIVMARIKITDLLIHLEV